MQINKVATFLITSLLASAAWAQAVTAARAPTSAQAQAPMRFGPGNTPGWSLMTPQERADHRSKMMGFTNYEDCASYLAEHHAMMLERARKQGVKLPEQPRLGFCQRLPHKNGSN